MDKRQSKKWMWCVMLLVTAGLQAAPADSPKPKASFSFQEAKAEVVYQRFEALFGYNTLNVRGYKGLLTVAGTDVDVEAAIDLLAGALNEKGYTVLVNRDHRVLEIVEISSLNKDQLPLMTDPTPADLTSRSQQLVRAVIHIERADATGLVKPLREKAKLPHWVRIEVDVFKNTIDVVATVPLIRNVIEAVKDLESEMKAVVKGAAIRTLQLRHLPAYQAFQMIGDFFKLTVVKSARTSMKKTSPMDPLAAMSGGESPTPPTRPEPAGDLRKMHAAYDYDRKLACYLDERSNSLIVNGLENDVNDIELYVRMVDRPAPSREGLPITPSTRVFPLQHATAVEVVTMLGVMLEKRQEQLEGVQASGLTVTSLQVSQASASPSATNPGTSSTSSSFASDDGILRPPVIRPSIHALGAGGLVLIPDERLNAVVALGLPEDLALVNQLVTQLDKPNVQVLIDITVLDVELTNDWQFGVAYRLKNQNAYSTGLGAGDIAASHFPTGLTSPAEFANATTPVTINPSPTTPGLGIDLESSAVVLATDKLNAFMHLLQREGRAELVSAPKILTENNRPAFIAFRDELSYEEAVGPQQVLPNTNPPVLLPAPTQYRKVEAGTQLRVAPHASENGSVLLDLRLELSEFGTREKTGAPPPKKNRTTTQIVLVQQGQALLIGGIIRDSRTKRIHKTPLLSDLPLIGSLFSNTSDFISKKETVFLLTPTILKDPLQQRQWMKDYRLQHPTLPWPRAEE